MSLAPELAAFIGHPVKPSVTPTRIEGYAGHLRADKAEPAATPQPTQEPLMPTGVYQRKKAASKAVGKPEAKAAKAKKPAAKAKAPAAPKARATGPRFGVFEDGTVELRLASCAGIIAPTEAREFLAFLKRIGVE